MATIIITRKLGDAIRRLQRGYRINKVVRRRWSARYLWISERDDSMPQLDEALVKMLEKNKLIVGSPVDHHLRYIQFAKRMWVATEHCNEFHLPEEIFWIEE